MQPACAVLCRQRLLRGVLPVRDSAVLVLIAAFFCSLLAVSARSAPAVSVEALLPRMAVLLIDGRRHTLRQGEQAAGVTLLAADAQQATLLIDGREHRLGVSDRVSANFAPPARREVQIARNARMQYLSTASINGRQLEVLVDTGANIVALSAEHAEQLGIDWRAMPTAPVETAGATVLGYLVQLRTVDVGGIRVDNVAATVIEGSLPRIPLLGMSYLQHVQLRERNGVLTLSRDW